ncbi:MAG: hypothetical protein VX436_00690 [Planctomycetota bacterium]|nr:hypothetical protein [Planctomycetota bacterium]
MIVLPVVYPGSPSIAYTSSTKASHLKTARKDKQEIKLGISESQVSSLTWVGYEEYEKHRAKLADVEQAEMTVEVAEALPLPRPEQLQQLVTPLVTIAEDFFDVMMQLEIAMPPAFIVDIEANKHAKSKPKSENTQGAIDNNKSDRDSDATSTILISPENWKAGKPVATEGVVLRPRRPSFTANQLVTSAPSSLLAILYIDRRGKPIDVVILLGTGSGSIDRSIESSLYKWRASGERIDELEDRETANIKIHITFSK